MLYHPDKHRDPELKRQAEQLFNQVHQAYEGKEACTCIHRTATVKNKKNQFKLNSIFSAQGCKN